MNIYLKIPAWHDREEQIISQPNLRSLPKLNKKDLFKVNDRLWQWHHLEYDCDNTPMSVTIVLHTYPEKTKEEEVAERRTTYQRQKVELPNGTIWVNVPIHN